MTLFFISTRIAHKFLDIGQEDMFSRPMNLDITTEDDKIMQGLWYEENGDLANSYKVFSELYKTTKAKAYQLKKIHLSLMLNKDLNVSASELNTLYAQNPNDKEVLKLILTLHLMQNKFDLANNEAEKLTQISNEYTDLEVASDAFLYSNEPNKAIEILKKIYDETGREDVALRIAIILSDMYGEHEQAIEFLKSYVQKYGSNQAIEKKLYEIENLKNGTKGKI
ncbi:MAG: hypothetical protein PHI79_01375 [Sulfurovaceae bacterium]|nr:hypothetical protein [Sulfurovaceae bacterium]